ncbi:hypothetical protein EDD28_0088 [Salana multivorans]|uniref:Uncharacterized protein n=1 Tax=Salana multivorans TaxID=120377 RepID=A0A3N2D703_9MICO|nr:hypothetical protein [Salana multivorans]ROR95532.1 hypothetical protein EDD28_0088 [Salana multivorans]
MAIGKKQGGGGFFKPADHTNDLAILVEPKSIKRDQKNEYNGQITYRDELTADVTVFPNSSSLKPNGKPEVYQNMVIASKVLVSTIEHLVGTGDAVIQTVGKPRGKNYYDWLDPEPDAQQAVLAYYESREAASAGVEDDLFGDDE